MGKIYGGEPPIILKGEESPSIILKGEESPSLILKGEESPTSTLKEHIENLEANANSNKLPLDSENMNRLDMVKGKHPNNKIRKAIKQGNLARSSKVKATSRPYWKPMSWETIGWMLLIVGLSLAEAQQSTSSKLIDTGNMDDRMEKDSVMNDILPLTLEDEPTTTIINIGESLAIEQFRQNPYISIAEDITLNSYQEIVELVDFKEIAVSNYNAIRYANIHNQQKSYTSEQKFHKRVSFNANSYMMEDQMEYALFDRPVDYDDCDVICGQHNAHMPINQEQIRDAFSVFGLSDQYIWLKTKLETTRKNNWTWTDIFWYAIYFNTIKIYPESPIDNYRLDFGPCKAYQNESAIEPEQIGFLYNYYTSDGKYDQVEPKRLEVIVNPEGKCKVVITTLQHGVYNKQDNHLCVCVRNQTNEKIHENKEKITQKINHIPSSAQVEDWRFKTRDSDDTTLENVHDVLRPRYIKINESQLEDIKSSYIESNDLTDINLEHTMSTPLTSKDFGKTIVGTLVKSLITDPKFMGKIHQKVSDLVKNQGNIKTVPTTQVLGENSDIPPALGGNNMDFQIQKANDKYTIRPKLTFSNWNEISNNINEETATQGIRQIQIANKHNLILKENILPDIVKHNKVSQTLIEGDIAMNEDSIVYIVMHKSFAEIHTFIPITIAHDLKLNHYESFPMKYLENSDEYLFKRLPNNLLVTPGEIGSNSSQCDTQLLQQHHDLDSCGNIPKPLDNINLVVQINDYRLYLIKQLASVSASCPNQPMVFFTTTKLVNIFWIHTSCMITVKDRFNNIRIPALTTTIPKDAGITHILEYDLHDNTWFPNISVNWVLLFVTMSILGSIVLAIIVGILYWYRKKPTLLKIIEHGSQMINKMSDVKEKITIKGSNLALEQDYLAQFVRFKESGDEVINLYADALDSRCNCEIQDQGYKTIRKKRPVASPTEPKSQPPTPVLKRPSDFF